MAKSTKRTEDLPEDLVLLSERLGHRFRDPSLLVDALTHASTATQRSYQRLEFLGDRVLGLVVAEMLYRRFPQEAEGSLAKRHAMLVRKESLAQAAASLSLAEHLRLSQGESDGGGRSNPAILADVCEALLGALYLDAGLRKPRALVQQLWRPLLEADPRPPQDSKTALQEWAQKRGRPLPRYVEVARAGTAHEPHFTVRVEVTDEGPAEGTGRSKRAAEQAAAGNLLQRLEGREPSL